MQWGDAASRLAGWLRTSLDNQSLDLIEATIGPPHARAGIVALYEGADVLLQFRNQDSQLLNLVLNEPG